MDGFIEDERPEISVDRSITGLFRELRARWWPGTITSHEHDVGCVLAHRFGIGWRKLASLMWCPYCYSIHPYEMAKLVSDRSVWDSDVVHAEIDRLFGSGEMAATRENFERMHEVHENQVYAHYLGNEDGEPTTLCFHVPPRVELTVNLAHIYDMPTNLISTVLMQMNRIAPELHWSLDEQGRVCWSRTGVVAVVDHHDD